MDRRRFLIGAATTAGTAGLLANSAAAQAGTGTSGDGLSLPVPPQPRAFGAAGPDFPKVGGDYGNQSYSTLRKINSRNISKLGGAWHVSLEGSDTTNYQQCSLVAQNGVLYVQTTQQNVSAIDGSSGATLWKTNLGPTTTNMRGVALGQGLVFSISGSSMLYALDQRTGAVVWKTLLAQEAKGNGGYLAGACTYFDGLVYIGTGGGDQGAVGRAYAVDAATGTLAWTFWGIPGPGEFGNDTWAGDSWKTGGGCPWLHPAIDPDLGLVYWPFGNPAPDTNGAERAGDNLFTCTLIALDAKTGTRRWHFQSVHHDLWDYDNVMPPVLADLLIDGTRRKAVIYGSKTGMFYILDRQSGAPLHGMTEKPVDQEPRQATSPTQPFPGGDSFLPNQFPSYGDATVPIPFFKTGGIFTAAWDRPALVFPGSGGGACWAADSFSQSTGYVYVGYGLISSVYSNAENGKDGYDRPAGELTAGGYAAVDPRTNTVVWRQPHTYALSHGCGFLSTAGRLLFRGAPDGIFTAMDDATGKELWTFQTGAGAMTAPCTYEAGGEQYVAIVAGGNWLPYKDCPRGDHLWAFKLGGTLPSAATPVPPATRLNDNQKTPTPGATANFTVTLGRVWNSTTNTPGSTEVIGTVDALAPLTMTVPAGSTVTFTNPAANANAHGAASFWEHEFDAGVLMPGQSFTHTFNAKGEFFYNDPIFPKATGKIIVT